METLALLPRKKFSSNGAPRMCSASEFQKATGVALPDTFAHSWLKFPDTLIKEIIWDVAKRLPPIEKRKATPLEVAKMVSALLRKRGWKELR